jgi:hypothetical protein
MLTGDFDPSETPQDDHDNSDSDDGSDDLPPVDKKVRPSEPPEPSGDELLDLAMLHGGPG